MKRLCLMGMLLATLEAQASALNYSYLQAGYGGVAFADDVVLGGVAFRSIRGPVIKGSYQINEHVFVGGGFLRMTDSLGQTSVTSTQVGVNLGVALALTEQADIVVDGQLTSRRDEACIGVCASVDDSSAGVSVGIRALPVSALEVGAEAGVSSADKAGSSSYFGLQLRGWFDAHSAVGFSYRSDDESNTAVIVDYRYTF